MFDYICSVISVFVDKIKTMKKILFFLGSVLLLAGCNHKSESGYTEDKAVMMEMVAPDSEVIYEENRNTSNNFIEQKIIKNGNLRFQTSDLNKTAAQIYEGVKKYKAQIQEDREGKGYNSLYRSITIRVPNKDFENLVANVSQGVSYFDTKEISSQDVTEQYIDIEARLKAKKELESRYLELLKKAQKVSEILEIERELSNIREEIEAKQGQLNYLQSRISMSTLEIYFYKQTANTGVTTSYGSKMWNAMKGGFEGISAFFLGLLYIWPFIAFSVIAYYIVRKKIRKRKNKQ